MRATHHAREALLLLRGPPILQDRACPPRATLCLDQLILARSFVVDPEAAKRNDLQKGPRSGSPSGQIVGTEVCRSQSQRMTDDEYQDFLDGEQWALLNEEEEDSREESTKPNAQ